MEGGRGAREQSVVVGKGGVDTVDRVVLEGV